MNDLKKKKKCWSESILTVAYVINRLLAQVIGDESPLEALSKKPNSFLVPP